MSTASLGMTEYDKAVHYLARQLYLAFCQSRGYERIDPPPHVPRWCIDYADTAIKYLGYDDEALKQLATDYK